MNNEGYFCKECNRELNMCICHLEPYTKIGDVSACHFLDNHVSYSEKSGSSFYQGWTYKHNQMKFKLNEKDKQITSLTSQNDLLEKKLDLFDELIKKLQLLAWKDRDYEMHENLGSFLKEIEEMK